MTVEEYSQLREERPELFMPDFDELRWPLQELVLTITKERLIARRTAVMLGREFMRVQPPDEVPLPRESTLCQQ